MTAPQRRKRRLAGLALFALSLLLFVAFLGASARAATDDRARAEATLREIESSPKRALANEMLARSRAALDRGARLRQSGDENRARLADALALTWAEAAREVLRAVDVEAKADATRRAATDAGVIAERERALLEEGIAQSGRLKAQLESAERDAKEQPARTSTTAANADADGGVRSGPDGGKPSAPKPKAPVSDGGAR